MTPSWFNTEERKARLREVAKAWVGTPFMPNACVRGAGVSCQKLASGIYVDAGFLPPGTTVPDGPMDWGHAHKRSIVEEYISENALIASKFVALESHEVAPGDMIGFTVGGCIHHLGVVVDTDARTFVHCWRGCGVEFRRYDDATFARRIGKVWRPIEP